MTESKLVLIFLSLQFLYVTVMLIQTPNNKNQVLLTMQVEELTYQNQEMKNLLLEIYENFNSIKNKKAPNNLNQVRKTSKLPELQISSMVENKFGNTIVDE